MPEIPAPPATDSMVEWIACVCVAALVGALVWLGRNAVPRLLRAIDGLGTRVDDCVAEFRAESAEQRKTFAAELREQRASFSSELREQRASHESRLDEIVSHCSTAHSRNGQPAT